MARDIYHEYSINVGIDMHVADGIYQGSRTYMLEIFSRVIKKCPNIKFYVFCNDEESLLNLSSSFSQHNVVLVPKVSKNPFLRLLWQFPYFQLKYKLDYFHVQYILPAFMFCKGIVSLHDILFESHPQYFKKSFVLRSKLLMRWSASRAHKIFTISSFSKDEICNRYKVAYEKIDLAYCGVSTTKYFPGSDGINYLKNRDLISKGYILYVGRLDLRKNLTNMIRAYSMTSMQLPIVLVGQEGFGIQELYKTIDETGVHNKVFFISDADDSELGAIYRHAACFVFPSFAEGFGLPVLEAMASGIPVITSNTTSLPEVAGDAGILVNPKSTEDIAKSINSILGSKNSENVLVEKGFEQVKNFSWETSAEIVAKFYLQRGNG